MQNTIKYTKKQRTTGWKSTVHSAPLGGNLHPPAPTFAVNDTKPEMQMQFSYTIMQYSNFLGYVCITKSIRVLTFHNSRYDALEG